MANAVNNVMEWTEQHDVCLCREILSLNLFKTKKKTTQRAQLWQEVADRLCGYDSPVFIVSKRAVRDRYTIITTKYRKRMRREESASGISPEQSELDTLIEELIERENLAEEESNNVKRKVEEDKCKAADMRKVAMENLAETRKRKSNDDEKVVKKKSRRSGSNTIEYLKERYELDQNLKKQQMEAESTKNEAAVRRHEEMMQIVVQQQQQMQHQMQQQMQQQQQQQMGAFKLMISQQNQMLMGVIEKFVPK